MNVISSGKNGLLQFVFALFFFPDEFLEVENYFIDPINGHCLSNRKDFFLLQNLSK